MSVIYRHAVAIIAVTAIGCGTVPSDRAGDPRLAQTTKLSAEQCIDRAMANPTADDESNYLIQPGDVLAIHFYLSPEFDDEVIVRPDGRITVRMVGEISAKGRTPAQLAEDLDRAYSRELTSPTATVHVKASPSRQIYVDGQVSHPGSFPMEPRMSTLQAIAVAGGLTIDAAPGSAVLIRRDACGFARRNDLRRGGGAQRCAAARGPRDAPWRHYLRAAQHHREYRFVREAVR